MQYALELTDVNKTYQSRRDKVVAVKDVSLQVAKGTVFGFLGPNGAGKTTTMKMIVGLAFPTTGTVTIFGERAATRGAAKHLGYLPENPTLYRYLSAKELVVMHTRLMGMTKKTAQNEADRLLELVGLSGAKNRKIREYSKGMVQRTGLAQALVSDPDLLLLDEPFDGLDVLGRFEMKQLILNLKKEKKTIFFNSHILSDVEEICDSVGIIDRGMLLEHGALKQLIKKESLEEYFVKRIHNEREVSS